MAGKADKGRFTKPTGVKIGNNGFLLRKGYTGAYPGRGGRAKHMNEKWRIEDDTLSLKEIGERLGLTPEGARSVLRREQKEPGPVTWARLHYRPKKGRPSGK